MKYQKIILHIGSSKTGTTSIQETLTKHSGVLEADGVFFPPDGYYHSFLESAFCDSPMEATVNIYSNRNSFEEIEEFHNTCNRVLFNEKRMEKCHTLVLSNERLTELKENEVCRMLGFLKSYAESVDLYCYLREPRDHFISNQKQFIRSGVATLDAPKSDTMFRASKHMPAYIANLGIENIHVRKFDNSIFPDRNVVLDFMEWLGIDPTAISQITPINIGESLSHEALQLANEYNQLFPLFSENKRNAKRALTPWIHQISGSPAYYPTSNIRPFESFFVEDREFIFEKFGITFDVKQLPDAPGEAWRPETQRDLVRFINQRLLEIQNLKSTLKFLEGEKAHMGNRLDQARNCFLQSLELNPENRQSLDGLAEVEAELKKS